MEQSVVIPAFNRAATVARAIESVLGQTHPPLEIVVVDDGSTDGTAEAVRRFGDRVTYLYQANAGAAAARNRGVQHARGEWVAFLDSDDYWLPDHLQRIAAAIQATGGRADLYFDDVQRPADEGGASLWALSGFQVEGSHRLVEDATPWALLPRQPMMLQASVVRRAAFLALGGFREDLKSREDTHLFFRICLGRPACAVAGCGAVMTADDTSGGRLTQAHGASQRSYWEATRTLYAALLSSGPPLPHSARRELRSRLATAHLRLSRHAWRDRQPLAAAGELARAFMSAPGRVLGGIGRRLGLAGSAGRPVAVRGEAGLLQDASRGASPPGAPAGRREEGGPR